MSGGLIRQGSACWYFVLHPDSAQTSTVGLALALGWVQFIAGKLTACHGLQKNPVQCNTVKRGVARGQQPTPAAVVVAAVAAGTQHLQLTEKLTGKIYMEHM